MVTRGLVIAGVVLAVLAVMVLGQGGGAPQGGRQWEYGVFLGEPLWSWYGPTAVVDGVSGSDFAREMRTAYSTKGPALEANVLNALGSQGWELIAVAEKGKYVLRRPK